MMAAPSRYSSALLSKLAFRPLATRPFTTSAFTLENNDNRFAKRAPSTAPIQEAEPAQAPIRRNPLIGNYTPATPTQVSNSKPPPVSTERGSSARLPHPSKPPVSSAEVGPNADRPPPPPPPSAAQVAQFAASEFGAATSDKHAYDATTPSTSSNYIDIAALIEKSAANYAKTNNQSPDPMKQRQVRTKPVIGRTIFVGGRPGPLSVENPVRAFERLDSHLKGLGVKRAMNAQKFHMRPGLVRKADKSRRWRKQFKAGFVGACKRVQVLKKQGW